MKDINFLKKQTIGFSKQLEQDKKIFKFALAGFSAVILVLLMFVGANFYFNHQIGKVAKQVSAVEQKIRGQEDIEVQVLFFVDKLKIIRKLFDLRSNKQAAIDFFINPFGDDVVISGIDYNVEERILSLTVTAPHIFRLEDVFKRLEDPAVKTNFESMNKSTLTRDQLGQYSFKITITFAEDFDPEELNAKK